MNNLQATDLLDLKGNTSLLYKLSKDILDGRVNRENTIGTIKCSGINCNNCIINHSYTSISFVYCMDIKIKYIYRYMIKNNLQKGEINI